jgi:hypothetical protein
VPLIEVTYKPDRLINPDDAANYDQIQAVATKLPVDFVKAVKTVDAGVLWAKTKGGGQFVWTKAAAMFGHTSPFYAQYKSEVDHLWTTVISAVGDGTNCVKCVGGLLRWRIALDPDDSGDIWLLWKKLTDDDDPITGRKISISEYFIKNDYVFAKPSPKKRGLDLSKLSDAWGASIK